MQKIVVGNWKMHGEPAMAHPLTLSVADEADRLPPHVEVIICPPATLLSQVATWLIGSNVKMGGQDCHIQGDGAYTGDISAPMLKAAGCSHIIVGHSERRRYHHESNSDVRNKARRVIETGLIPIICIGETQEDRDNGKATETVGQQIRECIPEEAVASNFMLAYEPVWAIGSGKTPTMDDIGQMHAYIVSVTAKQTGLAASQIQILYGGSVKPENARQIMITEGVSGVLVGGASLRADEFCRIMAAAG